MTYIFPFPPSINAYHRHIAVHGRPRTLISKKGRAYVEEVRKLLPQNPTTARLSVTIQLSAHTKRKYDIDNHVKALLDTLEGYLFENDEQIDELIIQRMSPGQGKVWVEVEEIE